jgi:histidine phosphotransferase ChpT
MSQPVSKLTASNLAALLCARICHDLVSPVGALSAALEVFSDDDNMDMREDALELIKLSAGQASAKLQFLRLAFGAGGSAPGIIGAAELKKLSFGVFEDGKVNINWDVEADGLDKPAARILLNLVMLGMQTIPRGGEMVVKAVRGMPDTSIEVVCTGMKARLDPTIVKTLAGGAPEDGFDGRSIQPFYTGMIARESGGEVIAAIDGETVTISGKIKTATDPD